MFMMMIKEMLVKVIKLMDDLVIVIDMFLLVKLVVCIYVIVFIEMVIL